MQGSIRFLGLFVLIFCFCSVGFAATIVVDPAGVSCASGESTTSTIQAAVDSARSGDTIVVCANGAASYRENVVVGQSLTIRGSGPDTIVSALNPNSPVFSITADSVTLSDLTVRDTLNGPTRYVAAIEGRGNELRVYNVTARNSGYGFTILLSSNSEFVDNTATGCANGFVISSSSNSNFVNNYAYENDVGFYVSGSSEGNTFTSNTANDNHRDGFLIQLGPTLNTFTSNTANGNDHYGFKLRINAHDNEFISNNVSRNERSGFSLSFDSNDNAFFSNTVNSNRRSGFVLSGVSGNILNDNIANDNIDSGYSLASSSRNTLNDNTAQENYYDLYVIATEDSHCDNTISNTLGSGGRPILYANTAVIWTSIEASHIVLCNADNSDLDDVTISGSDTMDNNGLMMVRTDDAEITNSVSSNNGEGFHIVSSNRNTFINNEANDGVDGFYVSESSDNTFTDNEASSTSWSGFRILDGSNGNTLSSNTANENHYEGFEIVRSRGNILTDNTANDNGGMGFFLLDVNDSSLSSNSAQNNANQGFEVTGGSGNTLSSNTAQGNSDSESQYYFRSTEATFAADNYAPGTLPFGVSIIKITEGSTVTALVADEYHRIVTDTLSFSFSDAQDVNFVATTDTSTVATGACSTPAPCRLVSNLLFLSGLSAGANIEQLLIEYDDSLISPPLRECNVQLARYDYMANEWIPLGASELNMVEDYVRYGPINTFGTFGAVVVAGGCSGGAAPSDEADEYFPRKDPHSYKKKYLPQPDPIDHWSNYYKPSKKYGPKNHKKSSKYFQPNKKTTQPKDYNKKTTKKDYNKNDKKQPVITTKKTTQPKDYNKKTTKKDYNKNDKKIDINPDKKQTVISKKQKSTPKDHNKETIIQQSVKQSQKTTIQQNTQNIQTLSPNEQSQTTHNQGSTFEEPK